MSICKRLVGMMGGEITVESKLGKGSTFFFTAWFGLNAKDERQRRVIQKQFKGLRVLVVDDKPGSRDALTEGLGGLPLRVDALGTIDEALAALRQSDASDPYDLVLIEWETPRIDGRETARLIKTDPSLRNIPAVLMVATVGTDQMHEEAREAGADGLLAKPVSPSTLFDSIVRLFTPGDSLAVKTPSQDSP